MKNVLLLISALLLIGCGVEHYDKRTNGPSPDPWKVIDFAVITVTKDAGSLYATETTTITYTSAVANQFTVDTSGVTTTESVDGNTIDLGTINASQLKVNDLTQCGVSGDEKCTSAIMRVYTNEITGFEGITGFINKTDSYGVPFKAGEGTADQTVGLTVSNAATVDSYTIPASDRKLTADDFNGVEYLLEVDFSNGGAGSYEMEVVIELAVGS